MLIGLVINMRVERVLFFLGLAESLSMLLGLSRVHICRYPKGNCFDYYYQ
jgi:hypothetical protein